MDYNKELNELKKVVEQEIGNIFPAKTPFSLYEPMAYVMTAGGKRLRPLLVILTCQAVGGKLEDCLDAALAVEILHAFTLVHDDIMDDDDTRRGLKTVHKKWDNATGILAGDGLVTKAFQTLLKTKQNLQEILQIFTNGLMELCEGQALDKEFEDRDDVTVDQYMVMIHKKTAKLIEVSCEIGAVLGGADDHIRRQICDFAVSIGEAFQIQDDLLDLLVDEKISGKPRGSDIMEKKKTYISIHFRENALPEARIDFAKLFGKSSLSDIELEKVTRLLTESGSIAAAQNEVEVLVNRAMSSLNSIQGDSLSRDVLLMLAERIRARIN